MSKSTEILMDEHKNILKIIEVLSKECESIEDGKEINKVFFTDVISFIRNYADRFHHAKEEDILFKEFKKCVDEGCVHCDPTEQMLQEHDMGRDFVKGMEEGVKNNDKDKVVRNAKGYAQLLQEHIFKEDNILYPMADEAFDDSTQKSILARFKEVENKKKEDKKKYLAFVKKFE